MKQGDESRSVLLNQRMGMNYLRDNKECSIKYLLYLMLYAHAKCEGEA